MLMKKFLELCQACFMNNHVYNERWKFLNIKIFLKIEQIFVKIFFKISFRIFKNCSKPFLKFSEFSSKYPQVGMEMLKLLSTP